MEFLNNMKVGKKLGFLIAVAFIALASMAVLGYYELEKANVSLDVMYAERLVPVALLNESRSHIRGINAAVLDLMEWFNWDFSVSCGESELDLTVKCCRRRVK